jgi:hypothetical protein
MSGTYTRDVRKKKATPAICGVATINGKAHGLAISLSEDGVIL